MNQRTIVKLSSPGQKNSALDLVDSVDRIDLVDSVDRISALPDSILGHILSLFPAKEVVETAFLSKRWKFVWRNVRNLEFSVEDCFNSYQLEDESMKFVRFVERVLLLHDGYLNKFFLHWYADCISSSYVNSLIINAVTRNINELVLCNSSPDCTSQFNLRARVFSCESLRVLVLSGIYVPDVDDVCLPRLESLKLDCSGFQSEEDFEKLISSCPVLNYLCLYMSTHIGCLEDLGISDKFTYMISSISLKRLELSFMYDKPYEEFNYSVQLKASSLEYLTLEGFISGIYVQKNLSSLIEVNCGIGWLLEEEDEFPPQEFCNSFIEILNSFDRVKVLTLSADDMWALSCATISLSTKFKRLKKLVTTTYCCYRSSIKDLMKNSDNLEVLMINQCSKYHRHHHDHSTWTDPVIVPRCLSKSLKKVVFHCYYDYDGVLKMIRYMLKHGSALEVVQIIFRSFILDKEKLVLVKEICTFPRKSPVCEVKIL